MYCTNFFLSRVFLACEPAGPGFDNNATYSAFSQRAAAKFVQCIHTSSDKGTLKRDCDHDWLLGNCGNSQVAAGSPPLGSHGLCPVFYNSAFTHQFVAIPRPEQCPVVSEKPEPKLPVYGSYFMGYRENVPR